jgi:hypothetical protein
MKTNIFFPYEFIDETHIESQYVKFNVENDKIVFHIDLGGHDFLEHKGIQFAVEINSTQTFYRRLFLIAESPTEFRINSDLLGDRIDCAVYLIAVKDGEIALNGSTDYHESGDYIGVYERCKFDLIEQEGFSGFIKIASTSNDKIVFDLTGAWITIELPQDTFEKYYPWQNDDKTVPVILASLGSSCVQFAILQALKQTSYQEKKWWESISKLLIDHGYNLDQLDDSMIPGATNEILGNCIQGMVNALAPAVEESNTSLLA